MKNSGVRAYPNTIPGQPESGRIIPIKSTPWPSKEGRLGRGVRVRIRNGWSSLCVRLFRALLETMMASNKPRLRYAARKQSRKVPDPPIINHVYWQEHTVAQEYKTNASLHIFLTTPSRL